jgi:hypothetical protein
MMVAERTRSVNASLACQMACIRPTASLGLAALLIGCSSEPDAWEARIHDLLKIRSLEDDWDGAGAVAPPPDLVDSAIILAQILRDRGYDAPSRIVPGVNGTVLFEWQHDGIYEELEVTEPLLAEVMQIVPGQPAEHWILSGN